MLEATCTWHPLAKEKLTFTTGTSLGILTTRKTLYPAVDFQHKMVFLRILFCLILLFFGLYVSNFVSFLGEGLCVFLVLFHFFKKILFCLFLFTCLFSKERERVWSWVGGEDLGEVVEGENRISILYETFFPPINRALICFH